MKHPLVVLPPQMLSDYYGERCRFLCGFQKASGYLRMRKLTCTSLQYMQTEMLQSQNMPQMREYRFQDMTSSSLLLAQAAHRAAAVC